MDVDWNPMGKKWSLFIHPYATSIHIHHIHNIHHIHPFIHHNIHSHPSTTAIHIHPSIHCFSLWPTFWSCKLEKKKKSTKEIVLTPNPDNTLQQKRRSCSISRRRRAWGEEMEKLKIIEKTHHHHLHHHHFLLLLLLLHYHLLHVETFGCRLNILLQKTEEVLLKTLVCQERWNLFLCRLCFFEVQNTSNFWGFFFFFFFFFFFLGVLFCFLVVCTIGTQEEELW
jgi:hypothetical protein